MGRIIKRWSGGIISKSGQDRLDVGIGESYRLSGVRRSAQDTLGIQLVESNRLNGIRKQAQDALNVQMGEVGSRIVRRQNLLRSDTLSVSMGDIGDLRILNGSGLSDNQIITVNGTGFGSFQGDVQLFTGGVTNAIQSAQDDTDFTTICDSRLKVPAFISQNRWRVDTSRTHGRSRNLVWDATDPRNLNGGNRGEGTMVFEPGVSTLGASYFRAKIFYQLPTATTDQQLKFLRYISQWIPEGEPDGVEDSSSNNILVSDRFGQGYFGANGGLTWAPYNATPTWFGDPGWGDTGLAALPRNDWFEVEAEFRDPTTLTSADGYMSWLVRRLSNNQVITRIIRNNVRLYGNTYPDRYKYLMLQLGFFNGAGPGIPEWGGGQIWLEDIYFRVRTRGRIKVTNSPVYSTSSREELCEEILEARTNNQVQFRLNATSHLGSLTGLYAFIWHPNGTLVNPTSGYPL